MELRRTLKAESFARDAALTHLEDHAERALHYRPYFDQYGYDTTSFMCEFIKYVDMCLIAGVSRDDIHDILDQCLIAWEMREKREESGGTVSMTLKGVQYSMSVDKDAHLDGTEMKDKE